VTLGGLNCDATRLNPRFATQ